MDYKRDWLHFDFVQQLNRKKEKTYENSWKAYTVGSILGTTTGNLSKSTEATILSLLNEENHRLPIADEQHLCIFINPKNPNSTVLKVKWNLGKGYGLGTRVEVYGLGTRVEVHGLGTRVEVYGLGTWVWRMKCESLIIMAFVIFLMKY